MALSGTFYTNVNTRWRIQGEWSATQDISANTSTVTLKAYWIGLDSAASVYSSATKTGNTVIEGTSSSFTGTAALNGAQKRHLHTQTRTITHNADGTFPDLDLSVTFNCEVTLNGTYYSSVSTSGSYALNTIPRASTLSSNANWTAGYNTTVSVNRASSSFSHAVDIYVMYSQTWYKIKTVNLSSSQTSVSTSFSTAEHTDVFNRISGAPNAPTRMIVKTYNGSDYIGSSTKDGTVTAPSPSKTPSDWDRYRYVDEVIDIKLNRSHSSFTHTLRFKLGSYTKTLTGIGASYDWNPSSSEEQSLYAQMPNDTSKSGTLEIDTFYNGVKVQSTQTEFFSWHVRNSHPTFTGSMTYADTNTTTTGITGNNQYIVQNKSTLVVTLPNTASASAVNGATLKTYTAAVAGESITVPYSTNTLTFDFGTINASTNQTITITVTDSRGYQSAISKTVQVVPYGSPTLSASANRVNGFEAETHIDSSGKFSAISVAGTTKNYITNMRYRHRPKNGTWSAYASIPYTTSGTSISGSRRIVTFDITKAYEVELQLTDRLATTTVVRTVSVGRPIFFIDDILGSIGFGDFPKESNAFLVNGSLIFGGNRYDSTAGAGAGGSVEVGAGGTVYLGAGVSARTVRTHINDTTTKELNLTSDGDVKIWAGAEGGVSTSDPAWRFASNGTIYRTHYNEGNGYQTGTIRSTVGTNAPMLVVTDSYSLTMNGTSQHYLDLSFPTSFDTTPQAVIVQPHSSQSIGYTSAVYNMTSSGCRVYLRTLSGNASSATIQFYIIAIGRRG